MSEDSKAKRMESLVSWANEKGICLYGPSHNTDQTWGAALGLWYVHGSFHSMEDAIEALRDQVEASR